MNARQESRAGEGVEGIDQSLNMLKSLQAKLKSNKNNYIQFSKNSQESGHQYTHTRIRTQPYSFSQRSPAPNYQPTAFTITQKSQPAEQYPNPQSLLQPPHTYSHSQPTMIEHNQNNAKSVKDIIKQNRNLKKYVNCLLQMNDYLKNQLVRRDEAVGAGFGRMGHSVQLELMRMEIEYLKELNRDKELELKRSMCIGEAMHIPMPHRGKSKSKSKEHRKTPSFQEASSHYPHSRSVSAYEFTRKNKNEHHLSQEKREDELENIDEMRFTKSKQVKKEGFKTPSSKKKNSSTSQKPSNSKIPSSKDQFKKKNTVKLPNSCKKCRLCYF